jgi:hypothetical protein
MSCPLDKTRPLCYNASHSTLTTPYAPPPPSSPAPPLPSSPGECLNWRKKCTRFKHCPTGLLSHLKPHRKAAHTHPLGPRNRHQQHHAQPPEAARFHAVALARPRWVAIDASCLDLGSSSPLNRLVDSHYHRSLGHRGVHKEHQQNTTDLQTQSFLRPTWTFALCSQVPVTLLPLRIMKP